MIYGLLNQLKSIKGLLTIIFIFSLIILLDLPWDNRLHNAQIHLQYQIRGKRHLSEKIVLIYIDAADIQTLQGWPITRDYYGYVTYVLNQLGVKAIGFDILSIICNHGLFYFMNATDFINNAILGF